MNNRTLDKLRQMRLYGMHDAFKNITGGYTKRANDLRPVYLPSGIQ